METHAAVDYRLRLSGPGALMFWRVETKTLADTLDCRHSHSPVPWINAMVECDVSQETIEDYMWLKLSFVGREVTNSDVLTAAQVNATLNTCLNTASYGYERCRVVTPRLLFACRHFFFVFRAVYIDFSFPTPGGHFVSFSLHKKTSDCV